jgi:hypothetical protein
MERLSTAAVTAEYFASAYAGRDVTDRPEQSSFVEPVDPFQCCELDGLKRAPTPEVTGGHLLGTHPAQVL